MVRAPCPPLSLLRAAHRHLDLFAAFSPESFRLATALADSLFSAHPDLPRPFAGAWTNTTFDLGPQTVTVPQSPSGYVRWCWLAITALGTFNPRLGGHIILWDLGRVLEFPPGATILIPSLLRFSICKIQPGETRYSFTQYFAAEDAWERWPAATALFSKLKNISSLRT
ncbi:hypothetical protein DFH06DRAFT_997872 [Mycena polygramma]|nr:hypothetical protein DFH06DRAFT_997872 [Mycena polygramma]